MATRLQRAIPFGKNLQKLRLNRVNGILRRQNRCYSSSKIPPLNIPLTGLPPRPAEPVESGNSDERYHPTVHLTTLPNGLKIASEDSFGQFCTVGVLIDAGSRYEIDYPSGLSHVLEKMAFQSTAKFDSNDAINSQMEIYGGHADCQSFRDCIVYAASAFASNLPGTMEVLSESVWHPQLKEEEVEEQKMGVTFELEQLDYRPEPEPQLIDLIHAAAYDANTLGLPKICPYESLPLIDSKILRHYMHRYYLPSRMTIAGVNVNHEEIVELCKKYFVDRSPIWSESNQKIPEVDRSIPQYTGGIITDHRDEPRIQPGPTPLPELAHVAVGFESAPYTSEDFYAFAVLNILLGGGGSFSAGGPGKGMYSRLYLNVLNRHHWMYSATAYNHSYADGGIFCIHASAHPNQLRDVIAVIIKEYATLLTGRIHEEEINRAKKQVQSMLMMNLESKVVVFEDIGRQVLGLGHRKSPQELCDSIEAVTAEDLKRACERMLSSKPSLAAIGNLSRLPKYEDIQKGLLQKGNLSSVGKFFFNRNCSDILPKALGPVRLITSQFLAKYDNREDQQISQTHRTVTHDALWSFLFELAKAHVSGFKDRPIAR